MAASLQHTLWSSYTVPAYNTTEGALTYGGRLQRTRGRIPLIYCHGYGGLPVNINRDDVFIDDFRAIANSFPILLGENAGVSTWANNASLASVDAQLAYMSEELWGIRSDKVALMGDSMGSLLTMNWAWRRQEKVTAIAMRGPIFNLESFYDNNPVFQGAIETAYGGPTGFAAALDEHDPARNLDLLRPMGHRIKVWIMDDDEYIDPDEAIGYAIQIGAEYVVVPGTHLGALNIAPDQAAMWLISQSRKQRSFYWDWGTSHGWDAMARIPITYGDSSTWNLTTDAVGNGRHGFATPVGEATGPGAGNDRNVYIFPEWQAVDTEMFSEFGSGNPVTNGQQAHFHRITYDWDTDVAQAYVIWQNIVFGVPYIINVGVWEWSPTTAVTGIGVFDTNQTGGFTPLGLVKQTGGTVYSSSRTSNTVTLVAEFQQQPQVGDFINVYGLTEASFNGPFVLTAVSDNSVSYFSPGSDIVFGGNGYFGNLSRTFPYYLRSQVRGNTAYIKAWKGEYEPDWDNPDFATTIDFAIGFNLGYGYNGIAVNHSQGDGRTIDYGPVSVTELIDNSPGDITLPPDPDPDPDPDPPDPPDPDPNPPTIDVIYGGDSALVVPNDIDGGDSAGPSGDYIYGGEA